MLTIALAVGLAVSPGTPLQMAQETRCASHAEEFAAARAELDRLARAGDRHAAIARLKEAYRLCPEESDNARELAAAEIQMGDEEAAEGLLHTLIRQRNSSELHGLLGKALASRGAYKESAVEYQLVATMDPTETSIFDFGTSLMKVNFGAATDVLQYGLKSFPGSVKIRVGLALALYAQDRPEDGARLLCEAAALDPDDVHPMQVLAKTRVVPSSIQPEAIRRFEQLRERYPKDGLILFDYAMVESGRWSGSDIATTDTFVRSLKEALALSPNLAEAWYQLALTYDQEKLYEQEIASLRKAIAIDAGEKRYHYRLAFTLRANGDTAGFKKELAIYTKLHDQSAGNK